MPLKTIPSAISQSLNATFSPANPSETRRVPPNRHPAVIDPLPFQNSTRGSVRTSFWIVTIASSASVKSSTSTEPIGMYGSATAPEHEIERFAGEKVAFNDCEMADGMVFSGTGDYDFASGRVALDITFDGGSLTYASGPDGSLTGTFRGRPVDDGD